MTRSAPVPFYIVQVAMTASPATTNAIAFTALQQVTNFVSVVCVAFATGEIHYFLEKKSELNNSNLPISVWGSSRDYSDSHIETSKNSKQSTLQFNRGRHVARNDNPSTTAFQSATEQHQGSNSKATSEYPMQVHVDWSQESAQLNS